MPKTKAAKEAQKRYDDKKAQISFKCNHELKKLFDENRNILRMSQPEYLNYLMTWVAS